MEINIKQDGDTVIISPVGNIDYSTAPEIDAVVEKNADAAQQMIMDLSQVDYISSAGLRILLNADELMADKDGFIIKNVSPSVMEVLVMTGFAEALTIEN